MFKITHVDDPHVLSALQFPQQSQANLHYLQNNLHSYNENLTASALAYVSSHNAVYQQINHADIAKKVRQLNERTDGIFALNVIRPLVSIDDFANATPLEQRIVMSSDYARLLMSQNKIDSYYGTYIDVAPQAMGADHPDYRAIWNGHMEEVGDEVRIRHYSRDDDDGGLILGSDQQFKARELQRLSIELMKEGFDVSNIFGGEVGK